MTQITWGIYKMDSPFSTKTKSVSYLNCTKRYLTCHNTIQWTNIDVCQSNENILCHARGPSVSHLTQCWLVQCANIVPRAPAPRDQRNETLQNVFSAQVYRSLLVFTTALIIFYTATYPSATVIDWLCITICTVVAFLKFQNKIW